MKIYLSGPITWRKQDETKAKFAQAAKQVEAFGHEPVNPFDNGLSENDTYMRHMAARIAAMFKCEGIYRLNGWEDDAEARLEDLIAGEVGLEIIDQPQFK